MNKSIAKFKKQLFTSFIIVSVMYGCGGTTGGAKLEESSKQDVVVSKSAKASAISVSNRIAYGAESGVPDKVKSECVIDAQLPQYLESFSAASDIAISRKDGAVSSKDRGKVLAMEFSQVTGSGGGAWSGAKVVAVTGDLFENGKKIGSFKARRTSGGGMWGAYKGTCSILDRCVKALGKDISIWLLDPTMDARLGEF